MTEAALGRAGAAGGGGGICGGAESAACCPLLEGGGRDVPAFSLARSAPSMRCEDGTTEGIEGDGYGAWARGGASDGTRPDGGEPNPRSGTAGPPGGPDRA